MTALSTKVSRQASYPPAAAGAGAAGAGDEKGTGAQAISKLTQVVLQSSSTYFTSGDSRELEQVLNLQPSTFTKRRAPAPDFQLNLSDREMALLRQTFEKWTIGRQSNLWEVWSVDFFWRLEKFMDLKAMATVPKDKFKDPVLNAFLYKFIPYAVSLFGAHLKRQHPREYADIAFFEKEAGSTQFALLQHRRQIASEVADIGRLIQKMSVKVQEQVKLAPEDLKKLIKDSKEIVERTALMVKLLKHEDASRILCEFNLSDLHKQLPKASAMDEGTPQRVLTDLCAFAGFIRRAYDAALKERNISVVTEIFQRFEAALKRFPKTGDRLAAIAELKKAMTPLFAESGIHNQKFQNDSNEARAGKLTYEQYVERNQMQVVLKKSQTEFNNSLFFKMCQGLVFNDIFHNFLDILDNQILSVEYPDVVVPTSMGFARLEVNLFYLVEREASDFQYRTVTPPRIGFLTTDQQEELTALLTDMRKEVQAATVKDLAWSDAYLSWMQMRLIDLTRESRYYIDAWVLFLDKIHAHIMSLDKSTAMLGQFLPRHLAALEKFLQKLPPKDLAVHREELIDYLEETVFEGCLDFCSFNIIARDMEAALQLNMDLSVLSPTEDKLLRPELGLYVTLEGLEEIFDKLTADVPKTREAALELKSVPAQPKTEAAAPAAGAGAAAASARAGLPMREDLSTKPLKREPKAVVALAGAGTPAGAGASAVPVQARTETAAARAQILSLTAASTVESAGASQERFRYIRGEKFRKLRQRLQQAGLLVARTRGRHMQMEGKEGKVNLTALAGAGTIKPGTGAAIARRMNAS